MAMIMRAEFRKLYHRKIFIGVLLISLFSLIYALGAYFHWHFITISGHIDLVVFMTSMWKLLMMLGLPLIFFTYLSASILGSETIDGQILLEILRVSSRKQLIQAKFITMILLVTAVFMLNMGFSCLFYFTLMIPSGNAAMVSRFSLQLLLISFSDLIFLILMIAIAFFFAIDKNSFQATLFTLGVYIFLMFLAKIDGLNVWMPGYFSLTNSPQFSVPWFIYHLGLNIFFILLFFNYTTRKFIKKQF